MKPGKSSSTSSSPSAIPLNFPNQTAPAEEHTSSQPPSPSAATAKHPLSRYESQKWRDWNTFLQYLQNHKPPLGLTRCSGAHVIEFLRYLDQFGKTKVHAPTCAFFGHPSPPGPCGCPLRQAWGSLDALIGRLRAAYEESGGQPDTNPFAVRAVRIYLRDVRDTQAMARGIPYQKKKRKRSSASGHNAGESSSGAGLDAGEGSSTCGSSFSSAP